jgi:energy-coupling factor transporter ATP-binding protein EcfA2
VATSTAHKPGTADGVYLASIDVEGFRGVGDRATLAVSPYPSLTLVVGRNGSGKSSFAEALELLLTGTNRRWENRSEIWREGWRNLHHAPTRIAADFIVEGRPGKTAISRAWAPESGLREGTTTIGGKADDGTLTSLGWGPSLAAYRPFLPHNELGALWDEGPTRLHDALAAILGLDDLTVLLKLLGDARLRREQALRHVTTSLAELRTQLEQIDDERAAECLEATAKRKQWDLDRLGTILEGDAGGGGEGAQQDLATLRGLAALSCPSVEQVAEHVRQLRAAARAVVGVDVTDAGRARATAALLAGALEHVGKHGDAACPVCGTVGAVGAEWQRATSAEIERLERLATNAQAAHAAADRERHLAASLLSAMPAVVRRGADVGVDTAALHTAWHGWLSVDPVASLATLADHFEAAIAPLEAATAAVRSAAAAELARREDAWRPVAFAARTWLVAAREVVADTALLPALKEAESWVKAEEKRLRDERFAPIAGAVQTNWTMLRQDSSVILDGLRLEGAQRSPTRRVALDVSIDGMPGHALGVMSQGELNALALSLFLPRASLPESPFRFIVIDDPVQAMDPNRIDGLARVLEHAARTHQVVVFTHDERLPAAVRRLNIEATVIEVVRRENSAVELRENLDPVKRHIEDAFAIANADDLPVSGQRIVPTFCRLALEAACIDVVIRRRLSKGARLADVEAELAKSQKLTTHLALALFDDATRGGDVTTTILNRWGAWAQGVYSRCNRGPHGADEGDLVLLCKNADRLAQALANLT